MRSPEAPPPLSVAAACFILFRLRWQTFRNSFWRGTLLRKLRWVLLLALFALAFYGIFTLSRLTTEGLRDADTAALLDALRRQGAEGLPADINALLRRVPSLLLSGMMTLLLFTSFASLLSALYLAGDMELLLAAPLPMRAVFVVKFVEALLPQTLLLLSLGLPLLLGFGAGMGYGPAFYAAAPLAMLAAPLLPAGFAALLVMAVVRVLPARRARDIVAALGGLLGMSFYVANQLLPELIAGGGGVWALEGLLLADLPLLPPAWAGRALVLAGEGAWAGALLLGGLFAGASLLTFALCLLAAERLYYAGWANVAASGTGARTRGRASGAERAPPGLARMLGWLPHPARAILVKDLRIFPRDLRQLQQLIFPLALAGIWIFRLLTGRPEFDRLALGLLTSVGLAFFVCVSISNVLAGTGISAEGRAFWLIRIAPVPSTQVLAAKFILAYAPFVLLGLPLLLVLLALQRSGPASVLQGAGLLLLLGLGVTGIALGLGAAFPKLDWDSPQRMWTLRTGCLTPICYFGYLALALSAALGLPLLAEVDALASYRLGLSVLGWLIALGLTVAALALPLRFGAARLDQLEV
jgi:ABC-2 type transport system permease protein